MFPDCYYHHNRKHFSLIHNTGEDYCYGHPLRFVGAELLSKYEPGKNYSPRAKLPPSWQRNLGTTFPIDSCTRDYRDWTTGYPGVPAPEVHFVWLSTSFVPFPTKPGEDFHLPDNMLGLPPVSSWPLCRGPIPWVLDPAEHPRPDDFVNCRDSTAPGDGSGDGRSRKRKRRGHRHHELKVTQKEVGTDKPQFFSSSSGSRSDVSDTTAPDSGVNLASPCFHWIGPEEGQSQRSI